MGTTSAGDDGAADGGTMNLGFLNLGFKPAPKATKAERARWRKEWHKRVTARIWADRAEYKRLSQSARAAYPAKQKLERLFHEVYGPEGVMRNPGRQIPEAMPEQIRAYEKLIRGNEMASRKSRSKKKKRNPRKGVMPAGLRRYWAKKRAKKAKRRNPRRRARVVTRTRTVVKYRTRKVYVKVKRRNPRRHRPNPTRAARRIHLKGFTRSQIKRVASAIRSATGKRVRIVKP